MVEIVFSESACGSLKIAQTYGRGKYRGSAISVFIRHENGSVPSSNEMKEAQLQAQEQELSRISASFHPPARAITSRNTEPNRFLLSSHELQIRVVSLRRIFRHIRRFVQSIPKSSSVSVSENGCFFMARMQNEPPAL